MIDVTDCTPKGMTMFTPTSTGLPEPRPGDIQPFVLTRFDFPTQYHQSEDAYYGNSRAAAKRAQAAKIADKQAKSSALPGWLKTYLEVATYISCAGIVVSIIGLIAFAVETVWSWVL